MSDQPIPTVEQESQNLELHVAMCRARHGLIDKRFRRIELTAYLILGSIVLGGTFSVEKLRQILEVVQVVAEAAPPTPSGGAMAAPLNPRR